MVVHLDATLVACIFDTLGCAVPSDSQPGPFDFRHQGFVGRIRPVPSGEKSQPCGKHRAGAGFPDSPKSVFRF